MGFWGMGILRGCSGRVLETWRFGRRNARSAQALARRVLSCQGCACDGSALFVFWRVTSLFALGRIIRDAGHHQGKAAGLEAVLFKAKQSFVITLNASVSIIYG